MSSAPLTDDEIVMDAKVLEAQGLAPGPKNVTLPTPAAKRLKRRGEAIYIVTWTNGLTALVFGDPTDESKWRRQLAKMYRAGCSGRRGLVSVER